MKQNRPYRVVIDTNLWISFIISRKLNVRDKFLYNGKLSLLFSPELLQEIESTIQKPRLKKYFTENSLVEMLTVFEPFIELIQVKKSVQICRNP